jgi:hypothetical protein
VRFLTSERDEADVVVVGEDGGKRGREMEEELRVEVE